MQKLITFTFAMCLTIACGCSGINAESEKRHESLLREITSATKRNVTGYKAIFFVPSTGCGDCISGAEDYLINTYIAQGKKGILFVITGLTSPKTARLRFGSKALGHSDVFFDYVHKFDKPPFLLQYPKALFLENGKVLAEREISPAAGEDVYHSLSSF